jgi:hypothetical protein
MRRVHQRARRGLWESDVHAKGGREVCRSIPWLASHIDITHRPQPTPSYMHDTKLYTITKRRQGCVCVCVCVCVWVGGKVGGWVWVCMCQVGVKCVSIQNMNEPAASPLIPARHKAVHARSGAALALSTDSHVTRSTAVGTKHSSTCPHLASPWSLEAVVASARPSPLAELRQVAEVPARQKAVRTYQMAI